MRLADPNSPPSPGIVVVDDEPEIRDLLVSVLERHGCRVTARGDAEEALRDIQSPDVSLLITDLRMPSVGGLELVRRAKARRPDLASIVVTAYASTETAIEALRQGVDDFVTKPFSVSDLCRTVDRVLDARRLVTAEHATLDRARGEADRLRRRQRQTQDELTGTRRALDSSRKDLERRVADLTFLAELTALLARETRIEPLLERTVRILGSRFDAEIVHLEVALPDDVHVAQHLAPGGRSVPLGPIARDLFHRAHQSPEGVVRETLLTAGRPMEALAAPLDLPTGPAGGLLVLRAAHRREGAGDAPLLSLVPRALAVALEAEVQRRDAVQNTLSVAAGMLEALESRGSLHRGHADRVSRLAAAIAEAMGHSRRFRHVVRDAARLHDIGAVGLPDDLLRRPGPLSPGERELLRTLPMLGARILAPFGEAAELVRSLHERPDGRGYPDGISGAEIPVGAAIIGCAEAYDAVTHHRAWRPSRSKREALDEIDRHSGTQFRPAVAEALRAVVTGPGA